MIDQVANRISGRLLAGDQGRESEAVQKGLEELRSTGVSENVQKAIECLMQFAFNAGGPALFFLGTDSFMTVDKDVWYDQLMEIVRNINDQRKMTNAVAFFQQKACGLKEIY